MPNFSASLGDIFRVFKVLDTDEKITDKGVETLDGMSGAISFDKVDFYDFNKNS